MTLQTVALGAVLVALLGLLCWYEWEYPCTRTESVWIPPHINLHHEADGNVSPQYCPGRWMLVCVERSARTE